MTPLNSTPTSQHHYYGLHWLAEQNAIVLEKKFPLMKDVNPLEKPKIRMSNEMVVVAICSNNESLV